MGLPRCDRRRALRVSFGVLAALALACSHGAPPPPEPGPTERADYVIGPADVLRVQVWRNEELTVEVPVRPDGRISFPLVNDVQAAGLTAKELKDVLTQALSEYIEAPDVTVMVREIRSKNVHVLGEVLQPREIPLVFDMRALEAISIAGGFSPYADKSDIRILRPNPDGSVVEYRFDYKAFIKGKHPEANMRLQPGDTIVVPD